MMLLAFSLRAIPKEFSIMTELYIVIWLLLLKFILKYTELYYEFHSSFVFHGYLGFVCIALDVAIILTTGLYTLVMTYRPNQIVPFPINEDCISNFVIAIIMPTSMTHFYQYLQNLTEFDEALIIFGLHADIRIYMRMYEERAFFTTDQIHQKAVQIFEDYIVEDCKWTMKDNITS